MAVIEWIAFAFGAFNAIGFFVAGICCAVSSWRSKPIPQEVLERAAMRSLSWPTEE